MKHTPPRIEWVDASKAVGLFLVFWGHLLYEGSNVGEAINRAIYSFHMPMYFILSGYVMKNDSLSYIDYCKNKFKRILLPALILYLFTLPFYFKFIDLSSTSSRHIIITIFYITGSCAYNIPVWFFFCLFQALIVIKYMNLYEANNKVLLTFLVACLFVTYIGYETQWKYFYLFGLNKCILSAFFIAFGILLRRFSFEKHIIILGAISLPVWIYTGVVLNSKVSMYSMQLGNFWLFIISSLAGSFTFFTIMWLLKLRKTILQYSKWTIFIVCSHQILITVSQWITTRFSLGGTYTYDLFSALSVLIILVLYKPICVFTEKKIPVLMGCN